MNKIKVLLCGGLGNQLFEYAMGRASSLRTGIPLELDAETYFRQDKKYCRHYELDLFTLPDEVKVIHHAAPFSRIERKWKLIQERNHPLDKQSFLMEKSPPTFQSELLTWQPRRAVKLLGYWQTEKYFEAVSGQIRNDLKFKTPALSTEWVKKINGEIHAVAVHIRRMQYSQCLDEVYYIKAMKQMREMYPECRFFCFSDDPEWADEFFKDEKDCEVVVQEGLPAIEDFKLFTCCRHFIIANSSFSWWAAWLGEKRGTKIFVPSSEMWDNHEVIPERWNVIKCYNK